MHQQDKISTFQRTLLKTALFQDDQKLIDSCQSIDEDSMEQMEEQLKWYAEILS